MAAGGRRGGRRRRCRWRRARRRRGRPRHRAATGRTSAPTPGRSGRAPPRGTTPACRRAARSSPTTRTSSGSSTSSAVGVTIARRSPVPAPTRKVTSRADPNRPSATSSSISGWATRQWSGVTRSWLCRCRKANRPAWSTPPRTVVRKPLPGKGRTVDHAWPPARRSARCARRASTTIWCFISTLGRVHRRAAGRSRHIPGPTFGHGGTTAVARRTRRCRCRRAPPVALLARRRSALDPLAGRSALDQHHRCLARPGDARPRRPPRVRAPAPCGRPTRRDPMSWRRG